MSRSTRRAQLSGQPADEPIAASRRAFDAFVSEIRGRSRRAFNGRSQKRLVLIINGHPDPSPERFCAALCDAYARGVISSGRTVLRLDAGELALPVERREQEPDQALAKIEQAVSMIGGAGQLTAIFPLWLNQAPVPLQQLFGAAARSGGSTSVRRQKVRMIVTMELPAFAHRLAHHPMGHSVMRVPLLSLPNMQMEAPKFIGCVRMITFDRRQRWLHAVQGLGAAGA